MDVLIDLIVYLIKQATQSRQAKAPPLTPQAAARQRAALQQQIMAMQQGLSVRKATAKAPAGRAKSARPPALPKTPASSVTAVLAQPPQSTVAAARPAVDRPKTTSLGDMRFPLVLGEILSAPVALREPEF
jgi:hypothetical protein